MRARMISGDQTRRTRALLRYLQANLRLEIGQIAAFHASYVQPFGERIMRRSDLWRRTYEVAGLQ